MLFVLIVAIYSQRIVMGTYWSRACTGRAWRRAFPSADKQAIRDFLQAFVDGFGFPAKRRLCFLPTDALMDIYNRVRGPCCDDMELEFFARELEKRYGLELDSCWNERITLGQIFSLASSQTDRPTTPYPALRAGGPPRR